MKKLAGLVIILAALVLGGYYGMGVLTERTIRKNIDVIDQSNGLYAEIEHYNRGFFSSDAQIKWQLHVPERVVRSAEGQVQTFPAQDYKMTMPLVIHHGPIIVSNDKVRFGLGYAESVFPFPKEYDSQFDAMFTKESQKPHLNLSIFVNYLNQSTVDSNIPEFTVYTKDKGRFDWLGMNATTTLSSEMKKIGGTITFDGMHLAKEDIKVDLSKVTTDYDLHETLSGIYLGDASFLLPSFSVTVKGQKMFEMTDFSVNSESDIDNHLFNTRFRANIKSLFANGQNYGPGDFEASLKNIDADVLAKINEQTKALQNATEVQRQQAMIALLPELPKLFSKGAEFEISKLSLKIPQGMVEGNLLIGLPKEENANPLMMMQKIHGNAKLKVPAAAVKEMMQRSVVQQIAKQPELQKTLMEQQQATQVASTQANQPAPTIDQLAAIQADKQLAALQQNGLLVLQGSDYFIEATLNQGQFTINGKPFDQSMLKF